MPQSMVLGIAVMVGSIGVAVTSGMISMKKHSRN